MTPLAAPGQNYLKTLPLSSTGRIGTSDRDPISILNDVCSNITLMDFELFRKKYHDEKIYEEAKVEVNGIGSVHFMSFARIPI